MAVMAPMVPEAERAVLGIGVAEVGPAVAAEVITVMIGVA